MSKDRKFFKIWHSDKIYFFSQTNKLIWQKWYWIFICGLFEHFISRRKITAFLSISAWHRPWTAPTWPERHIPLESRYGLAPTGASKPAGPACLGRFRLALVSPDVAERARNAVQLFDKVWIRGWCLKKKETAPSEDRTHDLQITLFNSDYETDALPTALLRLSKSTKITVNSIAFFYTESFIFLWNKNFTI